MNPTPHPSTLTRLELAAMIDHTVLDPCASAAAIDRACAEVVEHHFAAACVAPTWTRRAASRLAGTTSRVCTVVGFPSGAHRREVKVLEARLAIEDGARELDVVIGLGALKSGDFSAVLHELETIVALAGAEVLVKAILETGRLAEEEKREAARLAVAAGVAFVKTCTGFGSGGATVEDVRALRSFVDGRCGVKASGGIRTAAQAIELIDAGASRIGTSSGPALLAGLENPA